MVALTRAEAVERAAAVAVTHYDIDLDVTAPDTFLSTTTVTFTARAASTFAELVGGTEVDALLDGEPLPADAIDDERIALRELTPGEHRLRVTARLPYSHDGEGLHRFVDPEDGANYLCATSSIANAKRWFACFDQPDLKARYSLRVRCPQDWTVVGNGVARRSEPGTWELGETEPFSTYLVTLCAGPWHTVRGEHDGIPLGLHVRGALAAELDRDAGELLALTADALDAFHELFGIRYPFGEYHQAFVPEFNWGAMENPGCVTLRDQLVFRSPPSAAEYDARINTVVHEMAHMWFGDLVTMRWWDDLWLNESFAEYLAQEVSARIRGVPTWDNFAAGRKAWGYAADRHATTHPVAGNGAVDNVAALDDFDGISYAKGASVLRQLAAYLGEQTFLDGLRDYVRAHAWDNATFADLLGAWAARAGDRGAQLGDWAQQWLRTAGVDVIEVDDADGTTVLQRRPPEFGPPARRPHAVRVTAVPGDDTGVEIVLDADTTPLPPSPVDEAQVLVPDSGDQTWATIRLAAAQWTRLPRVLRTDVLPPDRYGTPRGVLWNAVRTALADGVISPALVVDALAAGLPGERDVVATQLLRWATDALPRYLSIGAGRDAAFATLTDVAQVRLLASAPGSRDQIAAARAWLAVTDDVTALRRWGDGDAPQGLVVDDELRWLVFERRAALGDLTAAQIDAAARRDPSAAGSVHAQRCRASRPDPDAKAAAWAAITEPGSPLSQYQLAALAGGIWVAGQEEFAMPYALRWFTDVPATAAFRRGWSLGGIAAGCFPGLAVRDDVLAAAQACAADERVPASLRRIAGDGADDLRRALAVRRAHG